MELHEVTVEQQQKEQEAKQMLHEMESIEEKYRQRMATLHDAIQERTKAVARYETKQVAVLKEVFLFFFTTIFLPVMISFRYHGLKQKRS